MCSVNSLLRFHESYKLEKNLRKVSHFVKEWLMDGLYGQLHILFSMLKKTPLFPKHFSHILLGHCLSVSIICYF